MRSEQSDEQSAEQLQEVKHPKERIAHRGICASPDAIFGSHNRASGLLGGAPQFDEGRIANRSDKAVADVHGLEDRVRTVARLRTEEGYMAEFEAEPDGSFLLLENHCPICAAGKRARASAGQS